MRRSRPGAVTLTSATASFQTSDVGRTVTVAGAGTAGALLTGLILSEQCDQRQSRHERHDHGVRGGIDHRRHVHARRAAPHAVRVGTMAAAVDTTQIV
jgi:hypothetical protein